MKNKRFIKINLKQQCTKYIFFGIILLKCNNKFCHALQKYNNYTNAYSDLAKKEVEMIFLNAAIIIFIVLETINVIILYFFPNFKYGNSISCFKAWNTANENENYRLFSKYMVNWVGNTKLIFIVLLCLILFFADENLKLITVGTMPFLIAMYYVRLHPIIKEIDKNGELTPKNYSKTLAGMIAAFIVIFIAAFVLYFVFA